MIISLPKTIASFSIFFFAYFLCEAQGKWAPAVYRSKFLSYVLIRDSTSSTVLIPCRLQYLYIPKSETFKCGGTNWSVGFNVARLFSKKFLLGFSLNIKSIKGSTRQNFSETFVNDFNSNFITTYSSSADSLRASTLREAINGKSGFGISGNNWTGYGISFSPFPEKYGGFIFEFKYNSFSFPFFGTYTPKIHLYDEGYYLDLSLNRSYSFDISFNPFKFGKKGSGALNDIKKRPYKALFFSFYVQRLNLTQASFDGAPLSQMVKQPFSEKYSNLNSFGIQVGLGFW